MSASLHQSDTSDREIVITRLLDAPRERVFEVWTDPRHSVHWWGPNGFTTTYRKVDVRPGGISEFTMHGPDGRDYPNRVLYLEVEKPERLVYRHGSGENDPNEFLATVTFEAQGHKTLLTLRTVFKTAAARDHVVKEHHAIEGGNQTLDRLQKYLSQLP